ncbi:MAG: FliM/FliN family flagellar motor switch protein [Janthinobacterium lividum]
MRIGKAVHGDAPAPGILHRAAWPRMQVSADAARLSRAVGHGFRIALDTPGGNAFLEILTPAVFASHAESEKVADAMRGTVLDGREGRLILGVGGLAFLCLLGGVPWPMGGASAKERLRAAAAVARLPEPLAGLALSLARLQAPSLSPVYRILAAVSKARAVRDEALVRQRLHARINDISCYCEAWAPARVWEALMRSGTKSPLAGARMLPAGLLPLRFGFVLGQARVSRSALLELHIGDVVRMPLWLGVDGTGLVSLGGLSMAVRIAGTAHKRAFEVVSIAAGGPTARTDFRIPFATAASIAPSRTYAMNSTSDPVIAFPFDSTSDVVVQAEKPHVDPSGNDMTDLLDAMSVTLSAEVGVLRLSVAALRALTPGTFLEIEQYDLGEVVLRTDEGRHLAGGRLVDIDGQMGIQVTKLGAV